MSAEIEAIYCPNCGHHVTRHPGNILCFNSEHMLCQWTPEDIHADLRKSPAQRTDGPNA